MEINMKGGTIEKVKNKSQNDNTRRVGYVLQHGKGVKLIGKK